MAVLGLRFCARAFSSCGKWGPLFIVVCGPLLSRSTGSRRAGSVIVAHGPSCSVACGILPDQGLNPRPLHWQADSQPLHHQGSPSAFGFLSKNKRHIFHFHQELYRTTYSPFCSNTFCHFSGNFIIPSSPNFLSFWAKNCSRCLLQCSRELKFFPLREFCKDRNKWKSVGATSGEYDGWIRTSQPNCNSFCLVIKEARSLVLSCWKIMHFLLTHSGHFVECHFRLF